MPAISIRTRLIVLVAALAMALILVGGLGFYTATTAEKEVKEIYEHQTVPMRELARIRRLSVENVGQMFRAMQHNPGFDYARLHNHPLSTHFDVIEKNLAWMNETLISMGKGLLPDSEEMRLLNEFKPLYESYTASVLKPAIKAMNEGDFSSAMVADFLKGNGEFEQKINPLLRAMAEAQQKSVEHTFQQAVARNSQMRTLSILTLAFGLLAGVGLAIWIVRSITVPLSEMRSLIVHTAEQKDFTGHLTVSRMDEIGQTAQAFNSLMQSLRSSLGDVRDSIARVDDATLALAAAADQASRASNETSESASSMAASVEQMSVSITSVSEHTREALAIANIAGEHSETGGEVIGSAVASMSEIADQVRRVGVTITELGQHSDRISSVVQVIHEVAEQTNLLALNAAIEAARAGEQGRGFAVVADEVRKLAERTSAATGEIAKMVGDIQCRSREAVDEMGVAIKRIGHGTELATQAGQAIEAIRSANSEVQRVFHDINEAMAEQGSASQDIAQRVERVAQASEQSAASVETSAASSLAIRDLAAAVRHSVEVFRV